jgi:hypothetical protein
MPDARIYLSGSTVMFGSSNADALMILAETFLLVQHARRDYETLRQIRHAAEEAWLARYPGTRALRVQLGPPPTGHL